MDGLEEVFDTTSPFEEMERHHIYATMSESTFYRNVEKPIDVRDCAFCGKEVVLSTVKNRKRYFCNSKCRVAMRSKERAERAIAEGRTPGKKTRKDYVQKSNMRGVVLRTPDGTRRPVLPISR